MTIPHVAPCLVPFDPEHDFGHPPLQDDTIAHLLFTCILTHHQLTHPLIPFVLFGAMPPIPCPLCELPKPQQYCAPCLREG
jgi:hypothetical protein